MDIMELWNALIENSKAFSRRNEVSVSGKRSINTAVVVVPFDYMEAFAKDLIQYSEEAENNKKLLHAGKVSDPNENKKKKSRGKKAGFKIFEDTALASATTGEDYYFPFGRD